jgi:hypothetical protein
MHPITLRRVKGSILDHDEVDDNFEELDYRTSVELTLGTSVANQIVITGADAGEIPSIIATGDDASVPLKLGYKGDQGYIQAGPDTYGAAGWAGFDGNIEILENEARTARSFAVYVEKYANNAPGSYVVGLQFAVGGGTGGGQSAWGVQGYAIASTPIALTDARVVGGEFASEGFGAGTLTLAEGVCATVASENGTVVDGIAVHVYSPLLGSGGTITNNCGIKVEDQTGGDTNKAIQTGLGKVEFGDFVSIKSNTVPADGDLDANEMAMWFDSTNGAAKFMVKAKQADGTVKTGSFDVTT